MVLQMAYFDRSRSPVIINAVPVLDVEDAVGWKVHAFVTRVEPRDAYDVAMALDRYSVEQLVGFALRVEPSLLPEEFADAARNLDATTDARFARIGLTPDVIALIRRRLATWPRDPSQLPGATGNQPRPHAGLRSERYAPRPKGILPAAAHHAAALAFSIGAFHVRIPDADMSGWNLRP